MSLPRVAFFVLLFTAALGAGFLVRTVEENNLYKAELNILRTLIVKQQESARGSDGINALSFPVENGGVADALRRYKTEKKDFVHIDLSAKRLALLREGEVETELAILTTGKPGSWWDTPSGSYTALSKEANHFSSIGHVWMPWSVQFYGNFFIHGWPHYEGGTPVPQGYSGGCVRLSTEDAKRVYDFVKTSMPIVITGGGRTIVTRPPLSPAAKESDPSIAASSEALLVYDFTSGAPLLEKNKDAKLPIASLAKLMTATVASELVYLERPITVTEAMLEDKVQSFTLKPGDRYTAIDLLYPLLMQSSNGAGEALAAFSGRASFIKNMNAKAAALGMRDATFADPSGVSDGNAATLEDMRRLAEYILTRRNFIFAISRGEEYEYFGESPLSGIENHNEFADSEGLIGVKNGQSEAASETMLTVWKMKGADNAERIIGIFLLGSKRRVADTEEILRWLGRVFNLEVKV
jgi:D-alanyl-D-alanine endopeptidase (penicillin-binding protein 7)